jgi:hypothetical protein
MRRALNLREVHGGSDLQARPQVFQGSELGPTRFSGVQIGISDSENFVRGESWLLLECGLKTCSPGSFLRPVAGEASWTAWAASGTSGFERSPPTHFQRESDPMNPRLRTNLNSEEG